MLPRRRRLIANHPALEVVVSGYDFPEGPAFDAQGRLHFVNWLSGAIVRVDPEGRAAEVANTGGVPAGLAFHRDGTLYIADEGDARPGVLRLPPDGRLHPWQQAYLGRPLNGANDLVFDARGGLYFTDSGGPRASARWAPSTAPRRTARCGRSTAPWPTPTGSPSARTGAPSTWPRRRRGACCATPCSPDGSLGRRETWPPWRGPRGRTGWRWTRRGASTSPSGAGGGWPSWRRTAGRSREIATPGRNPTNVAFGGPRRETLYITEAETGAVYRTPLGVRGLALFGDG